MLKFFPWDLRTGDYLWQSDCRDSQSEPLANNLECDIAVVGSGISGALSAWTLVKEGHSVVLLEAKGKPAQGSTVASTAILQYELDRNLFELKKILGEQTANEVYQLCFEALLQIGEIAKRFSHRSKYEQVPSLYLSSREEALGDLEQEYHCRRAIGLEVELLGSVQIEQDYPWTASAAIRSKVAAQIDPVGFTESLLLDAPASRLRIFYNTRVVDISSDSSGVRLTCRNGTVLRCRRLVLALGYENQRWLKIKYEKLHSTFAAASSPGVHLSKWEDRAVVWETNRPYCYLRRTVDNRILVGGHDTCFRNAWLRDALLPYSRFRLGRDLRRLLKAETPHIEKVWTGTFGESEDSLPIFGETPEMKNVFFVMACGGNGSVFAWIAAQMVKRWVEGEAYNEYEVFTASRLDAYK